jgi:hypothetical protein
MRRLIALVALVATAACNMDTATNDPLPTHLAGTYSLQTMNGEPLPFTVVAHDTTDIIDTDILTLDALGGWTESVNYRETVGTNPTTNKSFDLAGSWGSTNGQLNFRTVSGLLYIGSGTETSLNLTDAAYTYVFTR